MSTFDQYLSEIYKTSNNVDVDSVLEKKSDEEQMDIFGERLYYDQLLQVLDLSYELPSLEHIIMKFKTCWTFDYLLKVAQIQKANKKANVPGHRLFSSASSYDELYFMQSGAYGMVFCYNNLAVKFIYSEKVNEKPKCPEYDIPNKLYHQLFISGCSDLISKPKTMVVNVQIEYLYKLYKVLETIILLIYKQWKKLEIKFEDFNSPDIDIISKYKELLELDAFSYFIGPVYYNLIKCNIIFNKNLSSLFYFFQNKKNKNITHGTIFIYDKAVSGLDSLMWDNDMIVPLSKKQIQKNLMETHPQLLRSCMLQLLILFYNIYKFYPTFLHYDMKLNNVLAINSGRFSLKVFSDDILSVFSFDKIKIRLHDFDFSMIPYEYNNDKFNMSNLQVDPKNCNWFYEMRKFTNNLIKNFGFLTRSDPTFRLHLWEYFELIKFNSAISNRTKSELQTTRSLDELYRLIHCPLYSEFRLDFK